MLRLPVIRGVIDRRMLVNYRVDPDVMSRVLPAPFRPKLIHGHAIGGICLIRLQQLRPKFIPAWMGLSSENAAHRIAVQWEDESGITREGVYIPRRDSSSRLNELAGGRVVPGIHHHATFNVEESADRFSIEFQSDDGGAHVNVVARLAPALSRSSIFQSIEEASNFFECGSLGYSATNDPGRFDGISLHCDTWKVEPLEVDSVTSSFFDDRSRFPEGSATFDCALLMRGIAHEWHGHADLCAGDVGIHSRALNASM